MQAKKIFTSLTVILLMGVLLMSGCSNANAAGRTDESSLPQLDPVVKGEELAVLHTSMGDVKLRLFPEDAPKAVENFTTHAKNGYYDGLLFHRVVGDFMIQGGDPEGTGTGGESIWGGGFGYEKSDRLHHFRGALAMAHSQQPDSNGSQFYIVQNNTPEPSLEDLKAMQDEPGVNAYQQLATDENGGTLYWKDIFPLPVLEEYLKNGGTFHLDLHYNPEGHTVFGQVVEGMDVVDAIAAVETTGPPNHRPLEDITIDSISFETVE